MNSARIELKLALNQAGINTIILNTFSERFNIQKRIYLIQITGYDLGYRFSWYLRGPYCRNLTDDAFALRDEIAVGDKEYEEFDLTSDSKERIRSADSLWEVPPDHSIENDDWFELLASVHYLKHIAYWPKESQRDFDEVFRKLVESKPHFQSSRIAAQRAWDRLDQFGLIAEKTLG